MPVDGEGLAFPKMQQPGDRIDVAIGQHDAGDRAVAEAGPGMQLVGVSVICWRRSGEALIRNQFSPSALTAIDRLGTL